MMRDSLNSNSMHYSVLLTANGNALANQWRACTNCYSGHNASPSVADRSLWLRIVKTGTVIQSFFKRVGNEEWVQFGTTQNINFASAEFYVGIAVTSHDNSRTGVLKGSDFTIV